MRFMGVVVAREFWTVRLAFGPPGVRFPDFAEFDLLATSDRTTFVHEFTTVWSGSSGGILVELDFIPVPVGPTSVRLEVREIFSDPPAAALTKRKSSEDTFRLTGPWQASFTIPQAAEAG